MSGTFQLYLIRHAQSANNALPEPQRIEDPGITDIGQAQARLLGERFAALAIDLLETSAFRRALETTRPLATASGKTPRVRTQIHEVGGCYRGHVPGELEGRPGLGKGALQAEFPEFELPPAYPDHGWWQSQPYETDTQARDRAAAQCAHLAETFAGQDITLAWVIHADFKDLLLRQLLGATYHGYGQVDLQNTGVTLLEYEATTPRAVLFNDVSHLPEDLRTS